MLIISSAKVFVVYNIIPLSLSLSLSQSPAAQCGKIRLGDELVQINSQNVVRSHTSLLTNQESK